MPQRALLYRRPTEPQAIEVACENTICLVRLRRHRQARRYTLRIQAATREVILTMPPRGSLKEAKAFAEKHSAWIGARLGRLPKAAPFAHGMKVPLRGVMHRVVHRGHGGSSVWTEADGGPMPVICVPGERPHLARRVGDFLKREARRDLERASRFYAERIGVSLTRILIRDQTSRWGSCSTTGALSFSWRLILAPPFVLDYLAAHEVTHLLEMNHSPRFWRLLARLCPRMQRAKAWLDAHGADLHRYGEQIPGGAAARSAWANG